MTKLKILGILFTPCQVFTATVTYIHLIYIANEQLCRTEYKYDNYFLLHPQLHTLILVNLVYQYNYTYFFLIMHMQQLASYQECRAYYQSNDLDNLHKLTILSDAGKMILNVGIKPYVASYLYIETHIIVLLCFIGSLKLHLSSNFMCVHAWVFVHECMYLPHCYQQLITCVT